MMHFNMNLEEYFPVYLKNIDIWGFCITNTSLICELAKNSRITVDQLKCIDIIRKMYDLILTHSYTEIPIQYIVTTIQNLNKVLRSMNTSKKIGLGRNPSHTFDNSKLSEVALRLIQSFDNHVTEKKL